MSRGRGGPYNEQYYRHPPPYYQAREHPERSGPSASFKRSGPQLQQPFSNHYDRPVCPVASPRPPSPLTPSAPPIPSSTKKPPAPNAPSHSRSYNPHPFLNSFQYLQVQFLRGQRTEAPQFKVTPQKPVRLNNSPYQQQSGYVRYPKPSWGRGYYSQPPSFAGHPNQNQAQSKSYGSSSEWSARANALCDSFQGLSVHQKRPSVITLTPQIQDQVHRALKPSKRVSARSLGKKLHLPKKIVNQALYSLERSQKVSKQGISPPKWALYIKPVKVEEPQRSLFGSPQQTEVKLEIKTEIEEDSDTETQSSCSSSESSLSEVSHSSSPSRPQEMFTMSDQKERVLQHLLDLAPVTALMLAKNMGLKTSKQVNSTLYALEKLGDVVKNGDVKPPTWELSAHRKERMMRTLKATQSEQVVRAENEEKPLLAPEPMSELEPLPFDESWIPKTEVLSPSTDQPPPLNTSQEEMTVEGQWASDDIPEYLNAIRKQTDSERAAAEYGNPIGTVAVSLAAPPAQNLWAKLQEVRLKNPVSGLMEYAQYLGQSCEFILLDQSGPSHDPRFRMQVMLNGRLFPIVEASAKKVAKKDAAAATLLILFGEMQGGASNGNEGSTAGMNQTRDVLSNSDATIEGSGGVFGPGTVEVMGMPEGPRQPLSRSLPGGKNPVSVLMEYSQRSGNPIEFIITGQVGPPHDPRSTVRPGQYFSRFMYRVKVGESLFAEASAPSKKAARQLAAEEAVKELMADGRLQLNKPQLPLGSSSDSDSCGTCPSLPPLTADELRAAHEAGVGDLINHLNNNAVSGLLEYARARGFAAEIRLVGQSGSAHEPKFTYQAKLGGRWFPPVCASNKKQGKQEAADAALRVLIGEAERAARTGELIPAELPVSGSTLHDQIAMLSHQRFNALTTRIQHSLLGRKILATIVMRRGEGLGTVVSLGTGNRCVKGEELSLKGDTVNDGHAEIISRRGFVRFLYSELLKHFEGTDNSIFEVAQDKKLQIKSDITFHLYISTAPCGDGALFDKSCSETGEEVGCHQPLFENAKQGKLRTKVENGEGTIPVESSAIVPTWDGIQHGERLRTMSCSDKILRWNVLGLQGALLTHFLNPIYLKSITLGYLYSHGHLTRAVCCRLGRDGDGFSQSLPAPFQLNHPEVGRVSVYDSTRHTGKTKESSVNWSLPDHTSVEVLDGTKGKLDGNKLGVSRVSKSNLFCLFRTLCQRCDRNDLLAMHSYIQAKLAANSFQLAKYRFFQALGDHGYGAWIGKPLEEKSFEAGEESPSVPAAFSGARNSGAMEYNQAEA
ncbi:double-stranded RNA-specific adenosine deaminase isoform X1 [Hippocampus comes]|uniref:double-stranded RNA-specific adenosine deaminase isoform X1 n=1 Tax=Hippocampus comes TaxID=109280 RepID=UPI00094F2B15|nr:PREDICTED: double-stranded RNA-specific adenosine deaminase isoform X1 [Hippocampus comes]XP_019734273.1 PREDICTED: double-stranded RNA-specific adenosine deaminase isoform X1 [Hippocampus comes]